MNEFSFPPEFIRSFVDLSRNLNKLLAPLQKDWAQLGTAVKTFGDSVVQAMRPFQEIIAKLQSDLHFAKTFEMSGWLPHSTTPLDLIDPKSTAAEIDHTLTEYYREHWPETRQTLLDRFASYDVDEETKSVLDEALVAHETALYRCVPRALFPDIERVARATFENSNGKNQATRELRNMPLLLDTPVTGLGTFLEWTLYSCLNNHLYKQAKSDEILDLLSNNCIPNRHAAIHGLIVYATEKSSLNMLFIADYIYAIIFYSRSNKPINQEIDEE